MKTPLRLPVPESAERAIAPRLELRRDAGPADALASSPRMGAQLRRLESAFGSGVMQRVVITSKLKKLLQGWASEDEQENVIAWFKDADLLSVSDVEAATRQKFKDWWAKWQYEDPVGLTPEAFSGAAKKDKAEAPSDPLDAVRKKLTAAKLKPGDFTLGELQNILAGKDGEGGWDAAIQSINSQRLARIENARLIADRTDKYASAKGAGDLLFGAGLIRDVWNLSYAIATAGSASPNTTLAAAHDDADILAAAAAWDQHADIAPAPATQTAKSLSVSNMHVPGAPTYIEDKSTRAVNPDPTRGRQADFICHWGAVTVNVHVNSTKAH